MNHLFKKGGKGDRERKEEKKKEKEKLFPSPQQTKYSGKWENKGRGPTNVNT
jgi:hypothetical protein